jgi:hypothetical protein
MSATEHSISSFVDTLFITIFCPISTGSRNCQFLLKPCDADMLSASIARATSLNDVLNSRMLTNLVGSLRDLPSSPRVFAELKATLSESNVATEKIVHIVEQDVALSAKLLQLVNSAFFGLAQRCRRSKHRRRMPRRSDPSRLGSNTKCISPFYAG